MSQDHVTANLRDLFEGLASGIRTQLQSDSKAEPSSVIRDGGSFSIKDPTCSHPTVSLRAAVSRWLVRIGV